MKAYMYLNEKGNVASGVRATIKNATVNELRALLIANGANVIESDKGLAIQRGVDQNGDPIYAILDVTMTQSLDVKEKVKTASKTPVEPLEIPSIFAK
jgi:hypothetical protein